jgi:hypothetical protein
LILDTNGGFSVDILLEASSSNSNHPKTVPRIAVPATSAGDEHPADRAKNFRRAESAARRRDAA